MGLSWSVDSNGLCIEDVSYQQDVNNLLITLYVYCKSDEYICLKPYS